VSAVLKTSPPFLDRVVYTCLAKSPDERFQSALDVKLELKWLSTAQTGSVSTRPRLPGWVAYAALASIAVVAVILLWTGFTRTAPRAMQFTVALPLSNAAPRSLPGTHFFKDVCQFSITVKGTEALCPTGTPTRKRLPSAATSTPIKPGGNWNRGLGTPA